MGLQKKIDRKGKERKLECSSSLASWIMWLILFPNHSVSITYIFLSFCSLHFMIKDTHLRNSISAPHRAFFPCCLVDHLNVSQLAAVEMMMVSQTKDYIIPRWGNNKWEGLFSSETSVLCLCNYRHRERTKEKGITAKSVIEKQNCFWRGLFFPGFARNHHRPFTRKDYAKHIHSCLLSQYCFLCGFSAGKREYIDTHLS